MSHCGVDRKFCRNVFDQVRDHEHRNGSLESVEYVQNKNVFSLAIFELVRFSYRSRSVIFFSNYFKRINVITEFYRSAKFISPLFQ